MKKTVKILLSTLFILILISSLIACDVVEIDDVDSGSVAGTKEIVGDGSADVDDETTGDGEEDEATGEGEKDTTITEMVCFEYDGLTVTAKEIVNDYLWGTGIKLHIENNSTKDYSIGVKQAIVNNCMISDFFTCSVAAGKKTNDTLYLSSSDLKDAGIENIGQVEVYFYLYDSTTYKTLYEPSCVTIKTSFFDEMDTTVENAGHTLYDKDGIKIVAKYVNEATLLGKTIALYIENNSNANIRISCEDLSVNGYMITEYFSETIYSGKYALPEITLSSSDLEENDITEVIEVELKFRIYNPDTYQTIFETDALKFSTK